MISFRRLQTYLGKVGLMAVCLGLMVALPAAGKTKAAKTPPPVDHRVLVTAVDASKGQVTFTYQKQSHNYLIDGMTSITVSGAKGTIQGIHVGQEVFDFAERDFDTLDSIVVATADPAPVAPTKTTTKKTKTTTTS